MNITNCSVGINEYQQHGAELQILLSKLKSSSFADECRYVMRNYGRFFCCIFIKNGYYSEEYRWHVKHLSILANDITSIEKKN